MQSEIWRNRPPLLYFKSRILAVPLGLIFFTGTLIGLSNDYDGIVQNVHITEEEQARRTHFAIITEFMVDRKDWNTSTLGSWLFKFHTDVMPQKRRFVVYMNKYHSKGRNHLEHCSVKNCIFTGDTATMPLVDAILVKLRDGILPQVQHRNPQQRWIFLNEESPKHAFTRARKQMNLTHLADIFNWSMSYRSDSDIPVPFGRTVPLETPILKTMDVNALTEIIPYWKIKRRDVLATLILSSCAVKIRENFIAKLQKYIRVDVYGKCSKNLTLLTECPSRYANYCAPISEYLFYLSLEHSDCREYLTEKTWYNAYMQGAIPIIMGPPLADCKRLLPPSSFIYVSSATNDTDIQDLAKYITFLGENDDLLLILHQWRNHFMIINEHGRDRRSNILCRLCEGLNYNDGRRKIYSEEDIRQFIGPRFACGKNASVEFQQQ